MKILITASPWMGGSGTVGIQLANELAKQHQVYFLSFDFPKRGSNEPKNLVFYNFTTFSYALFPYPLYTESLAEKMLDIVKRHEIDLIHAHYSLVFGTSAILAKQFLRHHNKEVPVVVTMHGTDAVGFDPGRGGEYHDFENLNSFIVGEAEAITSASSYMHEFIVSKYGGEKVSSIIPNFIDVSKYKEVRSVPYRSRDAIVHISNFRKVKRPMLVAEMFKHLTEKVEYRGTKLLFVGDGPLKEEVERYVSENDLPNVSFLGQQDEESIIQILGRSRAIILPSDFENLPLVLLEALASGVPQIATDVGGMRDVVKDGETGFLVKSGDQTAFDMSERFIQIDNEEIWNRMSSASCEWAESFSTPLVISKYEELYRRLLKG